MSCFEARAAQLFVNEKSWEASEKVRRGQGKYSQAAKRNGKRFLLDRFHDMTHHDGASNFTDCHPKLVGESLSHWR
jgi:hypothetical protein